MSEHQLYLMGNIDEGTAMLQCERDECRVPSNCPSGLCWWTEELPYHATLVDARDAFIRHLKTHGVDLRASLEEITTSELIEELLSRQIDWRFYKQLTDNRLAEELKECRRREAQRQMEWRATQ